MSRPLSPSAQSRPHLAAGGVALALLLALAVGGSLGCRSYERATFGAVLPMLAAGKEHDDAIPSSLAALEHLKNQGTVLQQRAYERRDVLPLYGSSELVKRIPDKASVFFRSFPTGFSVFPVGKAGATSLILLQKIAALRHLVPGQRVALSLSPSWFFTEAPPEHPYAGNFSRQQALATLLNPRLDSGFKQELAQRLLEHPFTIERDQLLFFLTRLLAAGGAWDKLCYRLVRPLAELQRVVSLAQEHFETAFTVRLHPRRLAHEPPHVPALLDWTKLTAEASDHGDAADEAIPPAASRPRPRLKTDALFREHLEHSPEWADLELLLRGLHELGLATLVLSMPPNGVYFEHAGVSKQSLDLFSDRMRLIAERNGAQVETFEDHEEDVSFLVDHHDHMSAKGWMYYNRALDEFFHTDSSLLVHHFAKGHHKLRHPTKIDGSESAAHTGRSS